MSKTAPPKQKISNLSNTHMTSVLISKSIDELEAKHGTLIRGSDLIKILSYSSTEAFRQAHHRRVIPFAVFSLPHRKGLFAHTHEVAAWLASLPRVDSANDTATSVTSVNKKEVKMPEK